MVAAAPVTRTRTAPPDVSSVAVYGDGSCVHPTSATLPSVATPALTVTHASSVHAMRVLPLDADTSARTTWVPVDGDALPQVVSVASVVVTVVTVGAPVLDELPVPGRNAALTASS